MVQQLPGCMCVVCDRAEACPGLRVTRLRPDEATSERMPSRYQEIVPGERIVSSSTLSDCDTAATVSITTVEITAEGGRTRLLPTESGAFLDGLEQPTWREHGTSS